MTSVCHVESKILFLRVEHQAYLVATLHERNHLLMLHLCNDVVLRNVLSLLVIAGFQFGSQYGECGGKVLFFQYRTSMERDAP